MIHKIKQSPEPLEHDIPSSPWSSLTLDNFEYKGTKYLGAHLDSALNFKQHIKTKCKTAMFNLQHIHATRKYLTRSASNKLMVSLVISHPDYANALLGGLPKCSIDQLQRVQNIAAKIVLGKGRYDSSTRCLAELHWLPI